MQNRKVNVEKLPTADTDSDSEVRAKSSAGSLNVLDGELYATVNKNADGKPKPEARSKDHHEAYADGGGANKRVARASHPRTLSFLSRGHRMEHITMARAKKLKNGQRKIGNTRRDGINQVMPTKTLHHSAIGHEVVTMQMGLRHHLHACVCCFAIWRRGGSSSNCNCRGHHMKALEDSATGFIYKVLVRCRQQCWCVFQSVNLPRRFQPWAALTQVNKGVCARLGEIC